MKPLTRKDLYSLEAYAEARADFRARVMAHKKDRKVDVGPNAALYFEDRMTIQYQVQEMLRVERIFEKDGIEEELAAYNPLIPGGANLKATFMIEYEDAGERRVQLAKLKGIEDRVWVRVGDGAPVYAIADEDLERANEEKTSSVHFLRFELDSRSIINLKGGKPLSVGIDHTAYEFAVDPVPEATRQSLLADLA